MLDRNLYTIRGVPFTEVRSIRRHTPAFGWQYVIIVLSSGKLILSLLPFSKFAVHSYILVDLPILLGCKFKVFLNCDCTFDCILSLTLPIDALNSDAF